MTTTSIITLNNNNNNNNIIIKKLNFLSNEEILFFKCFKSLIIRKEIFRHVHLLEKYETLKISSFKQYYLHPFREYISILLFDKDFNESIPRNLLGPTIKSLIFGNLYNRRIKESRIPSSCTEIVFGDSFDKSLVQGMIPATCKTLILGNSFNQDLIPLKSLPNDLKSLKFGINFNKTLQINCIPITVTHLELLGYSQPLSRNVLPKNLKSLILGSNWDFQLNEPLQQQNFSSVLPDTIEYLKFYSFNQKIYDEKSKRTLLPSSLKKLIFLNKFNQPLVYGSLPFGLEHLELGFHYTQNIERGVLPQSLINLNLGNSYYWAIDKLGILPNQLNTIRFTQCSFQKIVPYVFPQSLSTVSIGYYFKELDCIPNWVKTLEVSKVVPNIPKFIHTLRFRDDFNNLNAISSIPDQIKTLDTGNLFNQPIKSGIINKSLETLIFGDSFNQPIEKGLILNSNIKQLEFGKNFQFPLNNLNLPIGLKVIKLSKNYKFIKEIPKNIEIILI